MSEKIIFEKIIEKIKNSEYSDDFLLRSKNREEIVHKLIGILSILEMDREALETYLIVNDCPDMAFQSLKNEPKYNKIRNFILDIVNTK